MKKNKSSIINYLKESKNYIIFIVALFFFCILVGILGAAQLASYIIPLLEDLVKRTENLQGIDLFIFIFLNNALTSLTALAAGILLGIFPIITTITNGIVLGFVMERTAGVLGFAQLWRILPHGIFELPAVFLSLALGLKLGFQPLLNYFKYYIKNNKVLVVLPFVIAIPLSIIALLTMPSSQISNNVNLPKNIMPIAISIISLVFYLSLTILILIATTMLANKKLRKIQLNTFKTNIINSIKIFFFVVIPLLIIAAIIETLLITLL